MAVFTAVNAATTFVANVSNFLIVVTMSRVAHALGAKQWSLLGRMVRAVLITAALVGGVSAGALWLARAPLLAALSLAPAVSNATVSSGSDAAPSSTDVAAMASAYLLPALLRVPPLLLLRACTSVLVGYQRMRLASAINSALAVADTIAFYIALHALRLGLRDVGFVIAATCAAAALIALIALLCLPPEPRVRVCPTCDTGEDDQRERVDAECGGGEVGGGGATPAASLLGLACDSLNVLIRSVLLSSSVLALTVAVAPLGSTALSAHAVVLQLWMLTSYVVDGFADAGTMIGASLIGAGCAHRMRRLTLILAALGLLTGLVAGILLFALRGPLAIAFTRDPATRQILNHGGLWPLLCLMQPVNSLVFVYDGLLYATRSFAYVRNALAAGVLLLFAPALGVTVTYAHTLLGIWGAKVGLNGWRCLTALVRIHCVLWPRWEAAPDTSDAYFTACDAGSIPSISGGRGTSSTLNAERRTSNDSLAAYAEVD